MVPERRHLPVFSYTNRWAQSTAILWYLTVKAFYIKAGLM